MTSPGAIPNEALLNDNGGLQQKAATITTQQQNQTNTSINHNVQNVPDSDSGVNLSHLKTSNSGLLYVDDNSSTDRLWESLLDTDPNLRTSIREAGQMTYLGESFPVGYFMKFFLQKVSNMSTGVTDSRNQTSQLHYQVRSPTATQTLSEFLLQVQTPDGHTLSGGSKLNYLSENKCFEKLPLEILAPLVSSYFECFHP